MATEQVSIGERETPTTRAMREFLLRIESIEGTDIELREPETLDSLQVVVSVGDIRSEEATRVFELIGDVLRMFPAARLNVSVRRRQPTT